MSPLGAAQESSINRKILSPFLQQASSNTDSNGAIFRTPQCAEASGWPPPSPSSAPRRGIAGVLRVRPVLPLFGRLELRQLAFASSLSDILALLGPREVDEAGFTLLGQLRRVYRALSALAFVA